jgi:hypothetical protein
MDSEMRLPAIARSAAAMDNHSQDAEAANENSRSLSVLSASMV